MNKDQLGKHDHYAIISFPRNATKTLSRSMEMLGYHNFSEFMDVSTSGIDLGWDKSYRLPAQADYNYNPALNALSRSNLTSGRYAGYIALREKYPKSVVTIWPETFFGNLNTLNDLNYRKTCMILITRENKFEQLISYTIAKQLWYWEEGALRAPVVLDENIFNTGLLGMNRIIQLHKMVKEGGGNYVELDFYDITHGRIPAFKEQKIRYERQMGSMYRYVANLDALKVIYNKYKGKL
jgi:hypothetical protein